MNTSSVKEGKHSVTFRTKLLISQQTSTLSSTLQFRAWQETGPESNCTRTKGEKWHFSFATLPNNMCNRGGDRMGQENRD